MERSMVVYPGGCTTLTKYLQPEILVARLESLFTSIDGLGKDTDGQYVRLALHLLQPWLTDHSNRQVRHLVAKCSTLLLSRYDSHQLPYRSANLRTFLLFIVKELSQLRNPETCAQSLDLIQMIYEHKTFLLASKQIYYDDICCYLLETLFTCFRDDNVVKSICQHAFDLMSQVIGGCDVISQSLLDNIFINMIKPFKSANKTAYSIAVHLLRIRKYDLETRIIAFFNDVLLEKQTESILSSHLYPLLYEVVKIAPELLIDVLPKLKAWLQCDQVAERREAVSFLAQVFSSISINFLKEQSILWTYFLDRFRDVNVGIRCICVSSTVNFFIYHQELLTYSPVGPNMIDHLKSRSFDSSSKVRLEFVMAVLRALKCRIEVPDDLMDCLEKRTRDKNRDVRKASVVGLSKLFNRIYTELDTSRSNLEAGYQTRTETFSHMQDDLTDDLIVRTSSPLETEEHTMQTSSPLSAEEHSIRTRGFVKAEEHTMRTSSPLKTEEHIMRTSSPLETEEHTIRTSSPLETEEHIMRTSSPLEATDPIETTSNPLEAKNIEMKAGVVDVDVRNDNEFDDIFGSYEEDSEGSNFEEDVDLLKRIVSDEKLDKSVKISDLRRIYDACNEEEEESCVTCDLDMRCFSIHSNRSAKDEDLESGATDSSEQMIVQKTDDQMCDFKNKVDEATTIAGASDGDKNMDDLEDVESWHTSVREYDSGDQQDMEVVEEVESRGSSLTDSDDGGMLQEVRLSEAVAEEEEEECDFEDSEETSSYDVPSEFEEIRRSGRSGFSSTCNTEIEWVEMLKSREQMIGNAVLSGYRNQSTQEQLLIENMLHTNLVPYSLSTAERMSRLLFLYSVLDDVGKRSLQEIWKVQQAVRLHLRNILEDDDIRLITKDWNLRSESSIYQGRSRQRQSEESKTSDDCVKDNQVSENINRNKDRADQTSDETDKALSTDETEISGDAFSNFFVVKMSNRLRLKIDQLLKYLPQQPPVTVKFVVQLICWPEIQDHLMTFIDDDCPCHRTVQNMRTILEMCRCRSESSPGLYRAARILLQRMAHVLVDMEGIVHLVTLLNNTHSDFTAINVPDTIAVDNIFHLLQALSVVYTSCFQATEVYHSLLTFIGAKDVAISCICLEVLANICQTWLGQLYPEIHRELMHSLMSVMKNGTPGQIKYVVRCLKVCNSRYKDFAGEIVEYHLTNNWTIHCPLLLTALSAIRQTIKVLGHSVSSKLKQEIVTMVVNNLLTSGNRTSPDTKIEGMKLVVVVLLFGCDSDRVLVESFLSMLEKLLKLNGKDVASQGISVKKQMALVAGCCLIKLARNPVFDELITFDQFHLLAFLFNDSCDKVHQVLLHKLDKGLWRQTLSVRYLAILSLVGLDRSMVASGRIPAVRRVLQRNIECCRDYVNNLAEEHYRKLPYILADYSIVYAVHLLSHHPQLASHRHNAALTAQKRCLEFLMKPLLSGIRPSSFHFHKKLLEKVKCSTDAQCPQDKLANKKLYAVTDLALMVLQEERNKAERMQRRRAATLAPVLPEKLLKKMTLEPHLPAKLFRVKETKMAQLSTSEAESLNSGLAVEVRSPDVVSRSSVKITVQQEKEQQEVEGTQEDKDSQESAAKRRKTSDAVSENKLEKITDYFRIISRSRESATESGGLLKKSVCINVPRQVKRQVCRQQRKRGFRDADRSKVVVFESEHSNTDEDSKDNEGK